MDAMIDNITESELVAALSLAKTASETVTGAMTTDELAKAVGRNVSWVRTQLRQLIDAGEIEPVRVQIVDIAGRRTTSPAYRLKASRDDKRSRTDI